MPAQKDSYGNTWDSEVTEDGEFVRHQTSFRSQIRADASTDFAPESGRVEPRAYLREATLRAVRRPGTVTLARELKSSES